jgi:hypothetical protein
MPLEVDVKSSCSESGVQRPYTSLIKNYLKRLQKRDSKQLSIKISLLEAC